MCKLNVVKMVVGWEIIKTQRFLSKGNYLNFRSEDM